jgi:hypothetical protein
MSAIATLKTRIHNAWAALEAEVPEEVKTAVADVETETKAFAPLLTTFGAAVKAKLAADEPTLKADVATLVDGLLADAAKIGVATL